MLALALGCEPATPTTEPTPHTAQPDAGAAATAPPSPARTTEPEPGLSPAVDPEPTPTEAAGPFAPLPDAAQQALRDITPDPAPAHLVRDTHYWISNEQSHFLWREQIADLGGALVGVGTDQNYLLAAWARSELIVLADFDAGVVDLHHAYGVLFDHAATPAEFRQQWSADNEPAVVARLNEALPPELREGAIEAYQAARPLVDERLIRVDRQYQQLGIATFLSDQAQYDHLRTLWRNGRVLALRGDLTADSAYVGIGDALRTADIEVGVLYLSNAEQYFKYTPGFRRNMSSLPMAERGVVLRTNGWKQFRYVADEEYHYNIQSARGFARWMTEGHAWGVPKMLAARTPTGTRGLSELRDGPPKVAGRRPPTVAP